ncbi:MAG: NADH-quinone oxidoreductase subunit J [Nitrospinota bacterium]|nr:MAG: NADH-quinone oxidoreductase subunit J [Nitrospinota bacterium]
MQFLLFFLLAAVMIFAAIKVVTAKNVVHGVLYLVLTFFCVAGVYILLYAEFLAAVQILIYASAMVILILFVLLLSNLQELQRLRQWHGQWPVALAIGGILLLEVIVVLWRGLPSGGKPNAILAQLGGQTPTEGLGTVLFTDYLLPFEVASILLLAAMIGAIILARRD